MRRKRYKSEEIVAKLRQVDVLVSQGQTMADAIRQIGVSEVTFNHWRQEFGGLKIEQVKRLGDERSMARSSTRYAKPKSSSRVGVVTTVRHPHAHYVDFGILIIPRNLTSSWRMKQGV
jgi:transposase-like protein